MERRKNFFDFLGRFLPGYKGYVIRDEKRNTDKKLRDELAKRIENSKNNIITHQQELIKAKEILVCQEWDATRKLIDTLYSKIKYATYGESSFFSEKQLKADELDRIYELDLQLVELVEELSQSINTHIEHLENPKNLMKQVKAIEESLSNRTSFINTFK